MVSRTPWLSITTLSCSKGLAPPKRTGAHAGYMPRVDYMVQATEMVQAGRMSSMELLLPYCRLCVLDCYRMLYFRTMDCHTWLINWSAE